jgi:hypothetical protein
MRQTSTYAKRCLRQPLTMRQTLTYVKRCLRQTLTMRQTSTYAKRCLRQPLSGSKARWPPQNADLARNSHPAQTLTLLNAELRKTAAPNPNLTAKPEPEARTSPGRESLGVG